MERVTVQIIVVKFEKVENSSRNNKVQVRKRLKVKLLTTTECWHRRGQFGQGVVDCNTL